MELTLLIIGTVFTVATFVYIIVQGFKAGRPAPKMTIHPNSYWGGELFYVNITLSSHSTIAYHIDSFEAYSESGETTKASIDSMGGSTFVEGGGGRSIRIKIPLSNTTKRIRIQLRARGYEKPYKSKWIIVPPQKG